MGQRFPICNANDVIRVLRRNGFKKVGQTGSHQKWRHADARQVIVADHKWFTRVAVADIIISKLKSLDLKYPTVSKARMQELQIAREMLESER